MLDFLKWILQVDIRWKNGVSALAALLSAVAFYFFVRHSDWFREIAVHGNNAILVVLGVALLIVFLFVWLILSGVSGIVNKRQAVSQAEQEKITDLKNIRQILDSTSNWQRSFLLRFINEDTMQINEWEVGEYKAVWGPEVDVLCAKGILKHHSSGVYEIAPQYWQYLQAFWDPSTETLKGEF